MLVTENCGVWNAVKANKSSFPQHIFSDVDAVNGHFAKISTNFGYDMGNVCSL